jgi:uncharacterized membrane protein YkvA (DUF1232 family)
MDAKKADLLIKSIKSVNLGETTMDFINVIQSEVEGYEGEHAELITQSPGLYRLLTRLLDDPNLPGRLRPLVILAIAYFILPNDIMPEDLSGAANYADDIFLAAFITDQVRKDLENGNILTDNWDGERDVLTLIDEILGQEAGLIGDRRELILWYIGYEYVC